MTEEQVIAAVYDPPQVGLPWLAVFIQDDRVYAAPFNTADEAQALVDEGAVGLAKLAEEQGS